MALHFASFWNRGLGSTREWLIDLLINTSQTITVSIYFAYTTQKDTDTKINAGAWSLVRAGKIAISVCSVKLYCQKYLFVPGLDPLSTGYSDLSDG